MANESKPEVAVVMGSASDWETMKRACDILAQFGVASLLSIVQMPGGIPVATTAVGNSGATNAGLLAVQMISAFEPELADKLEDYRNELKEKVAESNAQLV